MKMERNELFKSSDEYKQIRALIDKLSPWDKKEVAFLLADEFLNEDDMSDEYGFVDYDDIDPVKEVMDNNLEESVLDEMDSDDILDYFYKNYQLYMSAYVKPFHLAEFIDDVDSQTRESTLLFLKEKYPETFQEIREVIENNE